MVKNGIILSHVGHLGYETIGNLLRELDKKMIDLSVKEIIRKKIYAVMVECLENIDRHKQKEIDNSISDPQFDTRFMLEFKDNSFYIVTGNAIKNHVIDTLKNKLDMLNDLDEKGLKKLYRKTLLTGDISDKGGAGVGLIDMAKISQNKIEYSFEPINHDLSYYQIKLKINNSN